MENVFAGLTVYGSWNVKSSRNFNEDEVHAIQSAVVKDSQYGKSVCFTMRNGGTTFIPLGRDSEHLSVGTQVDMKSAKLLILTKPGEKDILRVEA